MNTERLLKLADDLDAHVDDGFNFRMHTVISNRACGTTGCIAGFVLVNYLGAKWHSGYGDFALANGAWADHEGAAEYLDLSPQESQDLFFNYNHPYGLNITSQDAAKVIRHFVETGKVDWSAALMNSEGAN